MPEISGFYGIVIRRPPQFLVKLRIETTASVAVTKRHTAWTRRLNIACDGC